MDRKMKRKTQWFDMVESNIREQGLEKGLGP